MVIPAFRGVPRTFGRYSGVGVSSEFVQQVGSLLSQGIGTIRAREALRGAGFRFRDSAFNAVRNEIQLVSTRGSRLNNIRLDARAGASTLVQTNREFGRTFRYTAKVRISSPGLQEILEIPVEFGSDIAMTRQEVIERAESIAEQTMLHSPEACILEGSIITEVEWTGAMQRAPR